MQDGALHYKNIFTHESLKIKRTKAECPLGNFGNRASGLRTKTLRYGYCDIILASFSKRMQSCLKNIYLHKLDTIETIKFMQVNLKGGGKNLCN